MKDDKEIKTKPVLGTILETQDEIDEYILKEIFQLVMSLQADVLVFFGRDKEEKVGEKHFGQMLDLSEILMKMNATLRNYEKTQKEIMNNFREKSLGDKNKNIFLTKKSPDLNKEIDYFLSGLKSALDQLSQILGHILNTKKIKGWNKGTENGKELSGIKIIRELEKIKPEDSYREERFDKLIFFIKENLEPLTYLVKLRDKINHRGGLKNISDITYDSDTKKVYPQFIHHSKNESELVLGFMKRTMTSFNFFINNFIILSYMLNSPNDMVVQRRDNPVNYNWGIIKK